MAIQTKAEADAELQEWYAARTAAAAGKSYTISTSNGTRTLTTHDLNEINGMIAILERRVSVPDGLSGNHNFAVANLSNMRR